MSRATFINNEDVLVLITGLRCHPYIQTNRVDLRKVAMIVHKQMIILSTTMGKNLARQISVLADSVAPSQTTVLVEL